jgi:hypothetical protein
MYVLFISVLYVDLFELDYLNECLLCGSKRNVVSLAHNYTIQLKQEITLTESDTV